MPQNSNRLVSVAALFFCGSLLCYAFTKVYADDEKQLKPLPKFLRNARLADRYLSTREIEDVLKFQRTEPVCLQLIKRHNVPEKYRLEAVNELAQIRKTNPVQLLISQVQGLLSEALKHEGKQAEELKSVVNDLAPLLAKFPKVDLQRSRQQIESLTALQGHSRIRQAAFASLIMADDSIASIWKRAKSDERIMLDALHGAGLVDSLILRQDLFKQIVPLAERAETDAIQIAAIRALPGLEGDMRVAFDLLTNLVASGKHVPDSVSVLSQIPKKNYNVDRLPALATDLLNYLTKLSNSDRAEQNGMATVALVDSISKDLPAEEQSVIQSRLRRLSVQIFQVVALEEKMAYDETVLIIESGRPARISFENHDIMPHNLVIGDSPAARVELGLMADEMQNDKNALAKGYLPDSKMLLHASKLIQPGQKDAIDFVLSKPGVYPFVCTFPGHWSKMYGAINVVEDANGYLASNHPLPTADDLLGIKKVQWKFEDLAANLELEVKTGRSFEKGQRWFKQASCYSCHRMQATGGLVGPDLTEISKKYKTATEVLTHIMQPSKTIEDKFASMTIIDADGLVHQGVVLKRTEEEIFILKNPLEGCAPTVINLEDIEEEAKSRVSPMPEKLLNTIVNKDEVTDLLAYIISGANEMDARFK